LIKETKRKLVELLLGYNVKIGNYKLKFDLTDGIQHAISVNGFEPEETGWVYKYLRPGDTFVDVGANCGYYSFIASGIVGETGSVYAFEPDPKPLEIFIFNRDKNKIRNICVSSFGLGEKEDYLDLLIPNPNEHLNNSTFIPGHHSPGSVRKTHVVTLDRYAKEYDINRINFIKIDIEGMEPAVIRGMHQLLTEKRVDYILVELHDKALIPAGTSAIELDSLIRGYGFVEINRKVYDEFYRDVLYRVQ
jgi:FkbM family methyltransferase